MTKEERLFFCKACNNKKLDFQIGIICSLTQKEPDFEGECPSFSKNEKESEKQEKMQILKQRAKVGRKKAINLFVVLMGLSLFITLLPLFMHMAFTSQEIVREFVRLSLTVGLCYAIYLGKSWAKIVTIVLFSIGLLVLLIGIVVLINDSPYTMTLLIPVIIYTYAIYFLIADKDFAAFFEYQKTIA